MRVFPILLLAACAGLVQAQSAYRWVDRDGKVHYGDRPPPPAAVRELEEKRIAAPAADTTGSYTLRTAQQNYPVTLYVDASCGAACQEGRAYLKKRGIPFSEKSLASDEEIAALQRLLQGAELVVPVLQVGEKTSKGFLETGWSVLLDAAGYPATR